METSNQENSSPTKVGFCYTCDKAFNPRTPHICGVFTRLRDQYAADGKAAALFDEYRPLTTIGEMGSVDTRENNSENTSEITCQHGNCADEAVVEDFKESKFVCIEHARFYQVLVLARVLKVLDKAKENIVESVREGDFRVCGQHGEFCCKGETHQDTIIISGTDFRFRL